MWNSTNNHPTSCLFSPVLSGHHTSILWTAAGSTADRAAPPIEVNWCNVWMTLLVCMCVYARMHIAFILLYQDLFKLENQRLLFEWLAQRMSALPGGCCTRLYVFGKQTSTFQLHDVTFTETNIWQFISWWWRWLTSAPVLSALLCSTMLETGNMWILGFFFSKKASLILLRRPTSNLFACQRTQSKTHHSVDSPQLYRSHKTGL